MWTREELKTRAKAGLKIYYWYGLLVCFVAGLLGAAASAGPHFSVNYSRRFNQQMHYMEEVFEDPSFFMGLLLLILSASLLFGLAALCFSLFVSNVVYVGQCRYFSISTLEQRNAGVEELFSGFRRGHYLNIVKTQFFRGLYEFLWSLLLIIPGIVKHYEYYMVPYLLAEYPTMDRKEIFHMSKVMMEGNKLDTWVLELSFIGWYLLGALFCCMGGIFVNPYREATIAELYLKLRQERMGIPRDILSGPADPYFSPNSNFTSNGNWNRQ
ncbi:MAG: DUF975 family protein [Lachnospiraceae bacterium]|nr:DUF975 family protein [Lachnospiraceae bacterium]